MVKDDLYITVPTFFRCPISLDVMKSPVSLCTGVTYDRSSIQRWLDCGNNTCPATMQVLQSKDFVPNHTLQRLIQIWVQSNSLQAQSPSNSPRLVSLTQEQAQGLIQQLNHNSDGNQSFFENVLKLAVFAKELDDNRRFLASKHDFVTVFAKILGDESRVSNDICSAEKVVELCQTVFEEYVEKERLARLFLENNCLNSVEILLQKGSLESKIASAKVLELIAVDVVTKCLVAGRNEMLSALLKLVKSDSSPDGIEAGLSCLVCISMAKQARVKLVRLGAVEVLGKALRSPDLGVSTVEKTLKLLEMVSSCREGRECVCGDEFCVAAIVQKVLKVSGVATERAVTILWSLCCLFRDHKAQEAVIRNNGLAKVLLLMQSNCSPPVRQMSGDLLKIFKVNSKCCLSSYDTKTTHIMPW